MKEVILCKYGEIILKGANKSQFESLLLREVRRRAAHVGKFDVSYAQSTVCITPLTDMEDMEEMFRQAKHVFGFVGITRAAVAEKTVEDICRVAAEYLPPYLAGAKKLRVEAKRSDKKFPLKSPELAGEVGGAILSVMPHLRVDLTHPDVTVRVEVRDQYAYIHAGQEKGAGGIPLGSGGRGLLLLSGGIDSPVAGYMMARRGLTLDALYFESIPYTSELAREKVFTLAKLMTEYCGKIRMHVISLTKIQEAIRDNCDEDYFTLLLRRFMMRLSCRMAEQCGAPALITGESLGQVASQTMAAICVTENASDRPILRPCIGMDKEEIVRTAREIGTFETSILPYEDCCTVFTPRHPKTQPVLEKVLEQEAKLDYDALLEEAWLTRNTLVAEPFSLES
ncbi:MAG: tRNA 4-thiouridine(8) synthase ThiI [Clostridia bacterium]|nr:tRNA 4-thiouridine(8) synthase ThiI [Clostridia bacterium]